jgi:hypothetical protein
VELKMRVRGGIGDPSKCGVLQNFHSGRRAFDRSARPEFRAASGRASSATTRESFIMRLVFTVAAAIVLVVAGLSYSGFCFSNARFLSDDEKIRLAVAYVVTRQSSFIEEQRAKNYASYDADLNAAVAAYLARDPSCCRIGPEGGDGYPEPTLWSKISGSISAIVVVDGGAPAFTSRRTAQIAITNCGRAWQ